MRPQVSGCRLQSRSMTEDPAKLQVLTMAEDLELIPSLDQRTRGLKPEA